MLGYEIIRRQTTFWDFRHASGRHYRVHFKNKEEFSFRQVLVPDFQIVDCHPVLLDYQHPWEQVYLSSKAPHPEQLLPELVQALEKHVKGWRLATHYLNATIYNNSVMYKQILSEGRGLLLEAPKPISREACAKLDDLGMRFTCLSGSPPRWPRQALIAGSNYVVARAFKVA